ncbi:inorganic pyrophosphatase 2-like protein [Cinnamomum micranthum f. kanehirae]|uniref:Inorganic pyrophosphatase 2-like protein n=1 Tax=Cinnamomum micranthum f. kanehirae TaxID=337451 RepID=A0A443NHV3_9MAGN|nr:inorganic pyrophosphatase 2-like protein [Cinnamomum micranthum f. kanehirae]
MEPIEAHCLKSDPQQNGPNPMAGIVVVFDFDKTIIDWIVADNWVVDDMGATDFFNELLP